MQQANKLKRCLGRLGRAATLLVGALGLAAFAAASGLILAGGLGFLGERGVLNVLFGTVWEPGAGQFGMLPLFLGTLYSTLGALLLAVPLGTLAALFLCYVLRGRVRTHCIAAANLLSRVPSVVFALLAIVWLVPLLEGFGLQSGYSLLAVIWVLAALLTPKHIITLVGALEKIPMQRRLSSLALGATRQETWFHMCINEVRGPLVGSIFSLAGKAMGETLAVIMVAGGVANLPRLGLATSTLATSAVEHNNGAALLDRSAVSFIALALLLITFLLTGLSRLLVRRWGHSAEEEP